MVTVAPASAMPDTTVPLLGLTLGADGAAASITPVAIPLTLPTASRALASIVVRSASDVVAVSVQRPSAPTVAVPTGTPPAVTVTIDPISPLPRMVVALLGSMVGVAGGRASTSTPAGPLILPAASVPRATTTVPSASGWAGVTVQRPLMSAVTGVPIGCPCASVSDTSAPTSAVPVTLTPLVAAMIGASGAI